MESLTSSSGRSSSSYRSSARYSSSSSFRSEGSRAGSCDSLEALLEPLLDSADSSCLFGEEVHGGPVCQAPFGRRGRSSYGLTAPVGGAVPICQTGAGGVQCVGDGYYMSADVSQFEPHDVVVMAYNHHVVIHAEKVTEDGSVSDTFTQKSVFPKDMNPLSVCGTFNRDGILVVSVCRINPTDGKEPLAVPAYRSEAHL
ncbi:heat shock protein beta-7-like [Phyllopteryx taeniolatus]|uniref:heat shock protein beta-7-like n=1 Tax=Phyllopteryx taeniolatus TaxID=161469 RepID=UPI002AD4D04E|nr:heat shock protein beta-7-like [Phyllopteryx taeniolatus]